MGELEKLQGGLLVLASILFSFGLTIHSLPVSSSHHLLQKRHRAHDKNLPPYFFLLYISNPPHLILVRPLNPPLHHARNLQIILLQEHEMAVPLNPDLAQLDPLGLDARLPQVIDHALVVRDVRRRLPRQRHVLDLCDLRQLPRRRRLVDARPPTRRVGLVVHGLEVGGGVGGRIVGDGRVGKTPGTIRGAADGAGGVAGVGLEGDGGRLEVDVAGDERGARVAEQDRVQGADGVADQVGAPD